MMKEYELEVSVPLVCACDEVKVVSNSGRSFVVVNIVKIGHGNFVLLGGVAVLSGLSN